MKRKPLTIAERNKILVSLGIEPAKTADQIVEGWEDQARALPKEKRQQFLDLVRSGKTIGEAREVCGMTMDEAVGTMNINMENLSVLRWETV